MASRDEQTEGLVTKPAINFGLREEDLQGRGKFLLETGAASVIP